MYAMLLLFALHFSVLEDLQSGNNIEIRHSPLFAPRPFVLCCNFLRLGFLELNFRVMQILCQFQVSMDQPGEPLFLHGCSKLKTPAETGKLLLRKLTAPTSHRTSKWIYSGAQRCPAVTCQMR